MSAFSNEGSDDAGSDDGDDDFSVIRNHGTNDVGSSLLRQLELQRFDVNCACGRLFSRFYKRLGETDGHLPVSEELELRYRLQVLVNAIMRMEEPYPIQH